MTDAEKADAKEINSIELHPGDGLQWFLGETLPGKAFKTDSICAHII